MGALPRTLAHLLALCIFHQRMPIGNSESHGKKLMPLEEIGPSPLAPKVCWRCGHENVATHVFCARCGIVLDKKEAFKMVERETMPLDKIISEDKAEFLQLFRKATWEELEIIVEGFLEPLKKRIEDAQRDAQSALEEHKCALKELHA